MGDDPPNARRDRAHQARRLGLRMHFKTPVRETEANECRAKMKLREILPQQSWEAQTWVGVALLVIACLLAVYLGATLLGELAVRATYP